MQYGPTDLQNQRQNQQAATGVEAAIPYSIDQPVTVPTFYQHNHAAEWLDKNPQITPPDEEEIHSKMWESSMMMGLMVALATGNVEGGLAGGMWAACAVHDHGYALRERSDYIDQLKADGYSYPAILKWYEEGDQSELDKERQQMLERDRLTEKTNEFNASQEQKSNEFNMSQSLTREQMANQMAIAQLHERRADARAANAANNGESLAHINPLMSSLSKPYNDTLKMLGRKQMYLDQARTDLKMLQNDNPAGYNALLTAIAGIDNPNISPREGAIKRIMSIGGLSENAKNWLSGKTSGTPSAQTLNEITSFVNDHQHDTDAERQAIHNKVYAASKAFVSATTASAIADIVSAGGVVDDTAPAISTTAQQEGSAASQVDSQGGSTATPQTTRTQDVDKHTDAPPRAVAYLKAHPETADEFKKYYGYLPEGF